MTDKDNRTLVFLCQCRQLLCHVPCFIRTVHIHTAAQIFLILKGILQQGQWLVAALYMLALAIIFVGMSVAVLRMFQGTRPTDMPECPRESALSVLPPMALGLCVLLLGFWMPDGVEKLLRASAALIGG